MKLDKVKLVRKMGRWVLVYRGYAKAKTLMFHARQNHSWIVVPRSKFWRIPWLLRDTCQTCFVLAVVHVFFPNAVRKWLKQ